MKKKFIFAGVFGGFAMLLVLLKCIFNSVGFFNTLVQSLLSGVIFASFGFGAAYLIETQVPQLWRVIEGKSSDESYEDDDYNNEEAEDTSAGRDDEPQIVDEAEAVEYADDSVDTYNSSYTATHDIEHQRSSKRMQHRGNSIIIDEKQFPDNPETLAKAIQTKMHEEE